MNKEVIATDIDEVLFPLVHEFSKWHNQEYGTTFEVDNFGSYEFDKFLCVFVPKTVHRVHSYLSVEHVGKYAEVGVDDMLFGDRARNQAERLPNGVIRYSGRASVLRYFYV